MSVFFEVEAGEASVELEAKAGRGENQQLLHADFRGELMHPVQHVVLEGLDDRVLLGSMAADAVHTSLLYARERMFRMLDLYQQHGPAFGQVEHFVQCGQVLVRRPAFAVQQPEPAQLGIGHAANLPFSVRSAVDRGVMAYHYLPVGGQMDVYLHPSGPRRDSPPDAAERVLGPQVSASAVGHHYEFLSVFHFILSGFVRPACRSRQHGAGENSRHNDNFHHNLTPNTSLKPSRMTMSYHS